MTIKGNAYTKTTWGFEERPVASAKLNTWDNRIEAALELCFFLLSQAWGGGNGVVRGATAKDLKVEAKLLPGMSVEVEPGYAFISATPYKLATRTETLEVTKPITHPRIDLVVADLPTGAPRIVTGTEAASPSTPSVPADTIPLASLYLRPSMTIIKNTNDGSNGYIIDQRTFL
jgi:hypothetical protein